MTAHRPSRRLLIFCLFVSSLNAALAQITPIAPFAGTWHETFESFPNYATSATPGSLMIMDGAASISHPTLRIYEPSAGADFTQLFFGSAPVADGTKGLGCDLVGLVAPESLTFITPVSDFGGYWRAFTEEANYMHMEFYGAGGSLIGSTNLLFQRATPLEWHGWHFDQAVEQITISSSLEGQPLWPAMDGLQALPVPEPSTCSILAVLSVAFGLHYFRRAYD